MPKVVGLFIFNRWLDTKNNVSKFLPIWIGIGAVAVAFLLVKGFFAFCRALTGWSTLAQRFPGADAHGLGQKFRCRGTIGALKNSNFTLEIAGEGLFLRPWFARKDPILIPWASIKNVSEVDIGFLGDVVLLTVDAEKFMHFRIPKRMLQAIQANIPADRFGKTNSLRDMINRRLQGRS